MPAPKFFNDFITIGIRKAVSFSSVMGHISPLLAKTLSTSTQEGRPEPVVEV